MAKDIFDVLHLLVEFCTGTTWIMYLISNRSVAHQILLCKYVTQTCYCGLGISMAVINFF